jgi:hypothetical protein
VISALLFGLGMTGLLGSGAGAPPAFRSQPFPVCGAALPLDAGQAFAGPRFLIQGDRLRLFSAEPPAPGLAPESRWRGDGGRRLEAMPPASGLDRARVKWRDGALWMKAGTRIYQRDPATGQWLLMADPGLEFSDFDLDLRGRTLLIATSDPRTQRYRALVEAVGADRRSTEILYDYPDPDFPHWFDRLAPMTAAALLTGYESVQIQEYLVLVNPLARRAFIYQGIDGTLKEADLGLVARGVEALAAPARSEPPTGAEADRAPEPPADPRAEPWAEPWADLCWQVLPRSPSEAWVVCPGAVFQDGREEPEAAAGWPRAIPLDLAEGRAAAPEILTGKQLPVFFDPNGRLTGLAEALDQFERASDKAKPGPTRASQPSPR